MALHSLYCADVPLRNCSLTHYWKTFYIRTELLERPDSWTSPWH